jgi:hypothetical protein
MKDNHGHVKNTHCPTCNSKLSAATGILDDEWVARPKDMSICINCGEILTFTDDLDLRLADLNDMLNYGEANKKLLEDAQRIIRKRGRIS